MRTAASLLAILIGVASRADAQTPATDTLARFPRTVAAIGAWDAPIVRRAAAMIASPARWSRSDAGPCEPNARTVSLRCVLVRATDDRAGRAATGAPAPARSSAHDPRLMDYNNDPSTRLDDVRTLFAEAPRRIR